MPMVKIDTGGKPSAFAGNNAMPNGFRHGMKKQKEGTGFAKKRRPSLPLGHPYLMRCILRA